MRVLGLLLPFLLMMRPVHGVLQDQEEVCDKIEVAPAEPGPGVLSRLASQARAAIARRADIFIADRMVPYTGDEIAKVLNGVLEKLVTDGSSWADNMGRKALEDAVLVFVKQTLAKVVADDGMEIVLDKMTLPGGIEIGGTLRIRGIEFTSNGHNCLFLWTNPARIGVSAKNLEARIHIEMQDFEFKEPLGTHVLNEDLFVKATLPELLVGLVLDKNAQHPKFIQEGEDGFVNAPDAEWTDAVYSLDQDQDDFDKVCKDMQEDGEDICTEVDADEEYNSPCLIEGEGPDTVSKSGSKNCCGCCEPGKNCGGEWSYPVSENGALQSGALVLLFRPPRNAEVWAGGLFGVKPDNTVGVVNSDEASETEFADGVFQISRELGYGDIQAGDVVHLRSHKTGRFLDVKSSNGVLVVGAHHDETRKPQKFKIETASTAIGFSYASKYIKSGETIYLKSVKHGYHMDVSPDGTVGARFNAKGDWQGFEIIDAGEGERIKVQHEVKFHLDHATYVLEMHVDGHLQLDFIEKVEFDGLGTRVCATGWPSAYSRNSVNYELQGDAKEPTERQQSTLCADLPHHDHLKKAVLIDKIKFLVGFSRTDFEYQRNKSYKAMAADFGRFVLQGGQKEGYTKYYKPSIASRGGYVGFCPAWSASSWHLELDATGREGSNGWNLGNEVWASSLSRLLKTADFFGKIGLVLNKASGFVQRKLTIKAFQDMKTLNGAALTALIGQLGVDGPKLDEPACQAAIEVRTKKDCWEHCGKKAGDCDWCGADMACCRYKGSTVGKGSWNETEDGCKGIDFEENNGGHTLRPGSSILGKDMHECVLKPGRARPGRLDVCQWWGKGQVYGNSRGAAGGEDAEDLFPKCVEQ